MKLKITQKQLEIILESIKADKVICDKCGWSWDISEGGDDVYTCHKCGHVNSENNKQE
jgi:tRNA(Ile2) C34 agmatinyltransferase TiaS